MRFFIALLICLTATLCKAQIKSTDLSGSWVAGKVNYLSGDDLPDENILKYSYVKYTFVMPDKMYYASVYHILGAEFLFEVRGNKLLIKSNVGFVVNTLKIMELTKNKLVMVMADMNGSLESPTAIQYTFYPEKLIQQSLALSPDDIYKISGTDTVFNSSQKIYALFNGADFSDHISYELSKVGISVRSGTLNATFIVNPSGKADSLKIIQGINAGYDKAYTRIFYAAQNKWKAAIHNGKPVKVLMHQEKKYFTSDEVVPSFFNTQKANAAYAEKNYEVALYYYDLALNDRPDDKDNLYRRGICRQQLGNLAGACSDWKKVQAMNSNLADALLAKYCK
ncbi:hypothetical protein G7074_02560 [Pedobacter sp. HDW13]|uniref:tetratricopeptide repeat protein n=1 Tax=Pedobacter sp. HDW13 TaxID=2714940 RepID=UPI001407E652|nr:tetratricopeptide repeat protein [Pedobacter sp. HDW13]QIL38258.1 hypothetical protein G7074_02560 [Pedobacter sp. HDW13]